MNTYAGRRRSFLLAVLLLLLSILVEQYWLVSLFPQISGLGGIRPMIVFLDIPLELPVIDPIPVGILFSFFYLVVIAPGTPRTGGSIRPVLRKKVRAALLGLSAWLVSLLAGGGLFYLLQDLLPRGVRNGIDSFGVRADVFLPYPGEGKIHLRGSIVMLIFCYAGLRIWMRMMEDKPAPVRKIVRVWEETEEVTGREGKKISMQIPEPVLVEKREPGPVVMTGMYPCIVDTEMVQPARK